MSSASSCGKGGADIAPSNPFNKPYRTDSMRSNSAAVRYLARGTWKVYRQLAMLVFGAGGLLSAVVGWSRFNRSVGPVGPVGHVGGVGCGAITLRGRSQRIQSFSGAAALVQDPRRTAKHSQDHRCSRNVDVIRTKCGAGGQQWCRDRRRRWNGDVDGRPQRTRRHHAPGPGHGDCSRIATSLPGSRSRRLLHLWPNRVGNLLLGKGSSRDDRAARCLQHPYVFHSSGPSLSRD
jgi:hypothetical protein